jgi:hypothetical protein
LLQNYVRHPVQQLVKELRYNPEGCGFISQWDLLRFFTEFILLAALRP